MLEVRKIKVHRRSHGERQTPHARTVYRTPKAMVLAHSELSTRLTKLKLKDNNHSSGLEPFRESYLWFLLETDTLKRVQPHF